ncbi:hypothetical protein B0H10DRAFT_263743 [Mycena sp. CBHHK59/15]|nr:hypothetical protein B0H10DRAFT_263743 [Mycena sp. CBHHK59/15]
MHPRRTRAGRHHIHKYKSRTRRTWGMQGSTVCAHSNWHLGLHPRSFTPYRPIAEPPRAPTAASASQARHRAEPASHRTPPHTPRSTELHKARRRREGGCVHTIKKCASAYILPPAAQISTGRSRRAPRPPIPFHRTHARTPPAFRFPSRARESVRVHSYAGPPRSSHNARRRKAAPPHAKPSTRIHRHAPRASPSLDSFFTTAQGAHFLPTRAQPPSIRICALPNRKLLAPPSSPYDAHLPTSHRPRGPIWRAPDVNPLRPPTHTFVQLRGHSTRHDSDGVLHPRCAERPSNTWCTIVFAHSSCAAHVLHPGNQGRDQRRTPTRTCTRHPHPPPPPRSPPSHTMHQRRMNIRMQRALNGRLTIRFPRLLQFEDREGREEREHPLTHPSPVCRPHPLRSLRNCETGQQPIREGGGKGNNEEGRKGRKKVKREE